MKEKIPLLLISFIEKQKEIFTLEDALTFFKNEKIDIEKDLVTLYLETSPFLFQMGNNSYVSKANTFKNSCFTIKPDKKEIEGGYLIIGHRTMPFTNPNILPSELEFFYAKKPVQRRYMTIPTSDIKKHYCLFASDNISQIIASDFANFPEMKANSYFADRLTSEITVLDLKSFYKKNSFTYGSKIVCYVTDWYNGKINIAPMSEFIDNPFLSEQIEKLCKIWKERFEECFLSICDQFDIFDSIYLQLARTLLQDFKTFSIPFSCSIEEVIESSKKIEIKPFGISNRLWKKDEEIIAIHKWDDIFNYLSDVSDFNPSKYFDSYNLYNCTSLFIDDFIVEEYLKDALYNDEKDVSLVIKRIIPEFVDVEKDDYNTALLQLNEKYAKLREQYSKFTDYSRAKVRHDALEIYSGLISLAHEVRVSTVDPSTISQQPFFYLMQLVEHLSKIFFSFIGKDALTDDDLDSMKESITGMKICFDENSALIMTELKKRHNNLQLGTD